MRIRDALQGDFKEILIISMLLLILVQAYLCVAFLKMKAVRYILVSLGDMLLIFLLFFHIMDAIYYSNDAEHPRTWPPLTTYVASLSIRLLLFLMILSLAVILWELFAFLLFRRESLSGWSIKETMDLLPVGIAFAEEDGKVVFANLTMNAISRAQNGSMLSDVSSLNELLGGQTEGTQIHSLEFTEGLRYWQFSTGRIEDSGVNYLQMTAMDITPQALINEELQGKNKKLLEIRSRLEIYNRTAERIIISQELLNARMQVHNETGHVLLASRRYMDQPGSIDAAGLLQTLKLTNAYLLREYEEDDTQHDPLSEAVEMAGAIGVSVKLRGMIPKDERSRNILSVAINECATNTKKHANGDRLEARTEERDGAVLITIYGNGKSPDKSFTESGGLLSLRTLVENAGGSMEIEPLPVFTVKIRLP
ncbi:MAG: hypothetical protein K5697_09890 [Lachnospiraceae bacterium]|nr:hypothetical protein [Lachnospiraceae bacterium]